MHQRNSDKSQQKQSAEIYQLEVEHLTERQNDEFEKDQQEEDLKEWQIKLMRASELRRNNYPQQAAQIIQKLIENIPTNQKERKKFTVAYYLLAEAYRKIDPPITADRIGKAYKMSIELDPYFLEAYRQWANFYVQENMPSDAINVYLCWAQKFPQNGEIYTKIGDLYAQVGNNEQSMKYRLLAMSKGWKGKVQRHKFSKQDEQNLIIYGP